MAKPINIHVYFNKLDRQIRAASASLLFFLILGISLLVVGLKQVMMYFQTAYPGVITLLCFCLIAILMIVIKIGGKISLNGNVHLWLDKYFLGFLKKSNGAILQTLLMALQPAERLHAENLDADEQNTLVQSIFSFFSNDAQIFDILLSKKIFRAWTFYWIIVYTTLVFLLLTIVSFITVILSIDIYSRMLFSLFWALSLFYLLLAVVIGNKLVEMSKQVVEAIVYSNKQQIVSLLRDQLYQSELREVEN